MKSERVSKIQESVRQACQSLSASLCTSYGPKGLDKMIIEGNKSIVTNDGATILSYYRTHPIHKILSEVSRAQDQNCGDGTTSVILMTCCLMEHLGSLLQKKVHPCKIVNALETAKIISLKYIDDIKTKIEEKELLDAAMTSLSSKITSRSTRMAEIVIEALSEFIREDVRIIKKIGRTVEEVEMFRGIVLQNNGNVRTGRYKMLVLKFGLSAPKTNMESKIVVDDHSLIPRFVREEREYLVKLIKRVLSTGANLLVIQKSLLRESCSDLARHLLGKLGISVIYDVDRKDVDYLCKMTGIKAVSDPEFIREPFELDVVEREDVVEISGHGCTIMVGGCDDMIADEAERAMQDVFGVVSALKREPYVVPGGGSVEIGVASLLEQHIGTHSLVINDIARAIGVMPYYLAQNAGINSVEIVNQLKKNIAVNHNMGICLRTGTLADMVNGKKIIQPAAVVKSMFTLAFETVQMLIRIDDILPANN